MKWGLKNYMDVAHELNWISKTAKDIGEVVRDYRNYIHPQKEYSHGINMSPDDAHMLWEVAKTVTVQILKAIGRMLRVRTVAHLRRTSA